VARFLQELLAGDEAALGHRRRITAPAGAAGLDEPTNGLDPAASARSAPCCAKLADDGMTVVVSSHLLGEIQTICDQLVVIDDGKLRFQGPVEGLMSAQRAEVIAIPEDAADLSRLADICAAADHLARIDGDRYTRWHRPMGAGAQPHRDGRRDHPRRPLGQPRHLEDAFFAITDNEGHEILAHAPDGEAPHDRGILQRTPQAPTRAAALGRRRCCRFTALFTVLGIERPSKSPGSGRGFHVSVAELSRRTGSCAHLARREP